MVVTESQLQKDKFVLVKIPLRHSTSTNISQREIRFLRFEKKRLVELLDTNSTFCKTRKKNFFRTVSRPLRMCSNAFSSTYDKLRYDKFSYRFCKKSVKSRY
uniref:Uncharacterized protein n=1 Tax=Cacopsylla melanoneura TaxID=428564 RepID=A0A8D9BC88_9HEMI